MSEKGGSLLPGCNFFKFLMKKGLPLKRDVAADLNGRLAVQDSTVQEPRTFTDSATNTVAGARYFCRENETAWQKMDDTEKTESCHFLIEQFLELEHYYIKILNQTKRKEGNINSRLKECIQDYKKKIKFLERKIEKMEGGGASGGNPLLGQEKQEEFSLDLVLNSKMVMALSTSGHEPHSFIDSATNTDPVTYFVFTEVYAASLVNGSKKARDTNCNNFIGLFVECAACYTKQMKETREIHEHIRFHLKNEIDLCRNIIQNQNAKLEELEEIAAAKRNHGLVLQSPSYMEANAETVVEQDTVDHGTSTFSDDSISYGLYEGPSTTSSSSEGVNQEDPTGMLQINRRMESIEVLRRWKEWRTPAVSGLFNVGPGGKRFR